MQPLYACLVLTSLIPLRDRSLFMWEGGGSFRMKENALHLHLSFNLSMCG